MVISNAISNSADIVKYLDDNIETLKYTSRFDVGKDCHATPMGRSHFSTLKNEDCPNELKQMIFSNFTEDVIIGHIFFQIQKYEVGDYIVPHKDNYISSLRLFILTSSDKDGLTMQVGDKYVMYKDIAGTEIIFDRGAWHWVNPVQDHRRYSLVIGI